MKNNFQQGTVFFVFSFFVLFSSSAKVFCGNDEKPIGTAKMNSKRPTPIKTDFSGNTAHILKNKTISEQKLIHRDKILIFMENFRTNPFSAIYSQLVEIQKFMNKALEPERLNINICLQQEEMFQTLFESLFINKMQSEVIDFKTNLSTFNRSLQDNAYDLDDKQHEEFEAIFNQGLKVIYKNIKTLFYEARRRNSDETINVVICNLTTCLNSAEEYENIGYWLLEGKEHFNKNLFE